MQLHLRVALQPSSHGRRFMHRKVIQNQVNLFSSSAHHFLVQEANELRTGVTLLAAALNFPRANFQSRQQGHRPMPDILDAV
jgi:hypothetical protein